MASNRWNWGSLTPVLASIAMLGVSACSDPQAVAPEPAAPAVSEPVRTAPPPASVPRTHALRVVVLGDSLSAGFGLAADEALPEQLQTRLNAGGVDVEVINAGVSGDTSANGLARYDWSVGSLDPDVVIIALGANDYLLGLSSDSTRANLAALIEQAQAGGTRVILAGLEPRFDAPPGSRDAAFAAIYPDLAETYTVPLYPALLKGVRDDSDLLQGDGLHPTAEGIAKVADQMAPFLLPLLQAEIGQPVGE